jgi:DNA invertase Pin-like site-specific DNA recombinase
MLSDLKAGQIDAVVAWSPDRLYRQLRDLEEFIEVVTGADAQVTTVQAGRTGIELNTPGGRLQARIMGSVARHEMEIKAERQKSKMVEIRANGGFTGGMRRYGYTKDSRDIVKAEAAVIREAATRFLSSEPLFSIYTDFNRRGVKTSTGKEWHDSTLRKVLSGARISGRVEYQGNVLGPAKWPAIVTAEQSDRIRAMLARPRSRGPLPKYLLTNGLAVCGKCGERLCSGNGNGVRTMGCRRPGTGCSGVGVIAVPVEQLVTDAVLGAVEGGALNALLREPDTHALTELADIDQCLKDLADEFGAGRLSRDEWTVARTRLRARRDPLQRRLNAMRAEVGLSDLPDPLRPAWSRLTIQQQQTVVGALVERVVVKPATTKAGRNPGSRGRPFTPDRVEIVWRKAS